MHIGFLGDIMLGRLVNEVINRHDYEYPWGNVLNRLKQNDLNIANLETTLTHSKKNVTKAFNFKASPDKAACLSTANIGLVNLANNHILDFSEEGLQETIQSLNTHHIHHVGAGLNKDKAQAPVIIKHQNLSIAVIGCTDNEPTWEANQRNSGTLYIDTESSSSWPLFLDHIKRCKEGNDFLIVSIHWGPNMRLIPTLEFQEFAHKMIEAGANIIHGHSAHVTQGVEAYLGGLILYDTGDFIDDYVIDPHIQNDRSFLFQVELDRSGLQSLTLIPVVISNCQVNLASATEYREMITRMQMLSSQFNTHLKEHLGTLTLELFN